MTAENPSRSATMPIAPVCGKSVTAMPAPASWQIRPSTTRPAAPSAGPCCEVSARGLIVSILAAAGDRLGRMSNDSEKTTGSNASGSQSGDSAQTWDSVDSGQSEDVENSLTGQGVSDRETTVEAERTESDDSRIAVAAAAERRD